MILIVMLSSILIRLIYLKNLDIVLWQCKKSFKISSFHSPRISQLNIKSIANKFISIIVGDSIEEVYSTVTIKYHGSCTSSSICYIGFI